MMSTSSVTMLVDKATSDLLNNPDWSMNIEICDYINSHPWHGKAFVKAVKKRLQHKNPGVQFLALTLLETMVKNCGDPVHLLIAQKNIPSEMVKMVKKKQTNMHIRDKILVLLAAWQVAFDGPHGKHPQYYSAYEELRKSGVQFPRYTVDATTTIVTPGSAGKVAYGITRNSSRRLHEATAAEGEGLSISTMSSMRNVMNLLAEMLQAVNPKDRKAIKEEIIIDLVNQCRLNHKKLMLMLTAADDEALLAQGLELNDAMQLLLAKHDAIASGLPLPVSSSQRVQQSSPTPSPKDKKPIIENRRLADQGEEEDDFAYLARRHPKLRLPSERSNSGGNASSHFSPKTPPSPSASNCSTCKAITVTDLPPPKVKTPPKEQDLIDLLSLTITTTSTPPPQSPPPSSPSNQNTHQVPISPTRQTYNQPYVAPQGQVSPQYNNNYVAPWAQPQSYSIQPSIQPQSQQSQSHYFHSSPQHVQPQSPRNSNFYSSPTWTPEPNYITNPNSMTTQTFWTPRGETTSSYSTGPQFNKPLQHFNSFPAKGMNAPMEALEKIIAARPPAEKPFVPSYKLFGELNVLGNAERFKVVNGASPSMSGGSSQSMVGNGRG